MMTDIPEKQADRNDDAREEKPPRRRRERVSRRRRQVKRGKWFVLSVLAASIAYYVAFFGVVVADLRLDYGPDLVGRISTSIIIGALAAIAISFAILAARGNEVMRQLFVILNVIGGAAGTIWLVMRYAQEETTAWMLMDLLGVIIAFLVFGAFFLSRAGVMFLDEQNLRRR